MLKLAASLVVGGVLTITLPAFALEQPPPEIPPRPPYKLLETIAAQKTVEATHELETAVLEPPVQSTLPTETIVASVSDDNAVGDVEVTGSKYDWLTAAGIPESDWWAVDFIVSKESSWNYRAINPSSGACGLAQSLPCSKIADAGLVWNDPVDALKWQYSYVQSRYGSYAAAYEFWVIHSWY